MHPGEIHALVGENGAGKSTLANIAFGAIAPDAGTVERHGVVGLVHQHFELVERLTVWENILLGREPRRGWGIDAERAREQVRALGERHGLPIDPTARIETLPVAIRQRVELLRELEREPAVLVLDEPTAALAPGEIEAFFATITALAKSGTAILIVTHKLAEVVAYCGRVSVLRAGKLVAELRASDGADAIARAMVGGEPPRLVERAPRATTSGLVLRNVSARSANDAIGNLHLQIAGGEIVGIAGVEGNGQSALADAVAGALAYDGEITLDGTVLAANGDPQARLAHGIAAIPQDRHREALVLDWTIAENLALGTQARFTRGGTIDRTALDGFAREIITRFDVRPASPSARMRGLSGGNQQKVVVGRALANAPRAVVAYQPTRGIDVGAATLVQSRLLEARNAGVAVLLISFELDELFALADRIAVLYNGAVVGTQTRDAFDRAQIGALMAGGR